MLEDQLTTHLNGFASAPFLFIGSGMSRRYLGLPDWNGLLTQFATKTEHSYARYRSDANGNLPRAASAIATEFSKVWWEAEEFAESRRLRESDVTRFDSPLKIEISAFLEEAVAALDPKGPLADEIALLRKVEVDGVITTNYDGLIEHLFPTFRTFVGQAELLFAETHGIGEIYKIHGSSSDPNSLVLTAEDYQDFNARNAYLAAKLLTVFVDHPIVFLGYSLKDENVGQIIQSIANGLTDAHLAKLQDRLVFVEWSETAKVPTLERGSMKVEGGVIPLHRVAVNEYSEIYRALGRVQRKLPVKLLRQLKERVYELVLSTDPVGALRVVNIDATTDVSELDVVVGVGVAAQLDGLGYVGLGRDDVVNDVLSGQSVFEAGPMVEKALPKILAKAKTTPVFKYLRGAGLLDDDGSLVDDAGVDALIRKRVKNSTAWLEPKPAHYKNKGQEVASGLSSFAELVEAVEPWLVLMYVTLLPDEAQDPEALRTFLLDHRVEFYEQTTNQTHVNHWLKAVCLYDWLVFGRAHATTTTES